MELQSLLVGGGILTGVGLVWNKIKYVFNRISNIFIEEHYVFNQVEIALSVYISENFSKSILQPRYFGSIFSFVRTWQNKQINKYKWVGFESTVPHGDTVKFFHHKLRPIWLIGSQNTHSNNEPSNSGGKSNFKVIFIRGTFNIEELVIKSLELKNEKEYKCTKRNNRFYVTKYFGTTSKNSDNLRDSTTPEIVAKVSDEDIFRGDKRFLGCTENDIGEASDDPFMPLAFPDYINDAIQDAKRWRDSEHWYKDKLIPWKRGWLLHGVPGTGKTSLVKAIGQCLDLPIHSFDLATMNNQELSHYWDRMLNATPCIALIEDLDAVFKGRENRLSSSMHKDKLTFDCLLNCISGVQQTDGVFVIITTNNIHDIDEAIGIMRSQTSNISSRPGRIDRVLELKALDTKCRQKIARRILNEYPDTIEKAVAEGDGDTGAQFQERCSQIALKRFWENRD
jgi:hypothetical protein